MRAVLERWLDSPRVYGWSQTLSDPGRLAPLRRAIARIPHGSLLDLGCGIGDLCGMTGAPYTGVDRSAAYIAYARRRFGGPGRRFVVGDALALDPALGHHDLVVAMSVLHHFDDGEVRRCLASLAAVTPRRLAVVDVAAERAGAVFRRVFVPLDRGHHYRTTPVWLALLASCGWTVEREDGFSAPLGVFPNAVLVAAPPR